MTKGLVKRIIRTKWQYGLNPKSFYINIWQDGHKTYFYDSERYGRNFLDINDFWFKFYLDYCRIPTIRGEYDAPSDICELRIEKYNPETGEKIKAWDTRRY